MKNLLFIFCMISTTFCELDVWRTIPPLVNCEETNHTLPQESEALFGSFLFCDYLEQIKRFVSTEKMEEHSEIEGWIRIIQEFEPGDADQNRLFYMNMLTGLRNLITQVPESEFLDRLCLNIFQSMPLWDSYSRFLNETVPTKKQKECSLIDLFLVSDGIYSRTRTDEHYIGRDKSFNITHDQMLHGNIPYALFRYNQTQIIRTPAVTKDTEDGIAIAEEFYRYLLATKKEGKRHLYINLLTQKYKKEPNLDPQRRQKIHDLEKDPAIEDSIFVLTLDKNSPFYFQTDEFQELNEADAFKNSFLNFLCEDPIKFTWSRYLNKENWNECLRNLLDEVHIRYFNQQELLSVRERLDFIDIVYLEIVKKAISIFKADTINISCMHTIDRGISILAHLYLDGIMQERNTFTQEEVDRFNSLVLIQPIVLHNTPAHLYRVNRIVSSSLRMYTEIH